MERRPAADHDGPRRRIPASHERIRSRQEPGPRRQYDAEKAQAVSELKERPLDDDHAQRLGQESGPRSAAALATPTQGEPVRTQEAYLDARRLIRSWEFARGIDVSLNYQPRLNPADPWKNLEQRYSVVFDCLRRLQRADASQAAPGSSFAAGGDNPWLVLSVPAFRDRRLVLLAAGTAPSPSWSAAGAHATG